jgi:hypothetical protein
MITKYPHLSFAQLYAAPIRIAFTELLRGHDDPQLLEKLVRDLAREAKASGAHAEHAIIAVKLSVQEIGSEHPLLVSSTNERPQYNLLEQTVAWVLDEFYGPPSSQS